jgi:hypothetical protein
VNEKMAEYEYWNDGTILIHMLSIYRVVKSDKDFTIEVKEKGIVHFSEPGHKNTHTHVSKSD